MDISTIYKTKIAILTIPSTIESTVFEEICIEFFKNSERKYGRTINNATEKITERITVNPIIISSVLLSDFFSDSFSSSSS